MGKETQRTIYLQQKEIFIQLEMMFFRRHYRTAHINFLGAFCLF